MQAYPVPELSAFHREKKDLTRRSNFAALAVLVLFAMSPLLGLVLSFLPSAIIDFIQKNYLAYLLYYALVYILTMGLPVLFGRITIREPLFPMKKAAPALVVALVLVGLALCMTANVVNNYFLDFLYANGMVMDRPPSLQDGSVVGLLCNLAIFCVCPAVLEELLFRGVVLQQLRPAGDRTAILLSSVLFSVMHGNMKQLLFAFVVGLVLGYVAVRTNSLLPSMLIHFFNNALSVVNEYLTLGKTDEAASNTIMISYAVVALLGVTALAFLAYRARAAVPPVGDRTRSYLPRSARRTAVWLAPVTLVVIALFLVRTVSRIQWGAPTEPPQGDAPSANAPQGEPVAWHFDISGEGFPLG